MRDRYFIGVDGGGTKTIAVAAREDGTVLARAEGMGINWNSIGMEAARRNLKETVDRLKSALSGTCLEITVGSAALDMPATEDVTRLFAASVFDADTLDLQSDAYITLMGFSGGQAGLIVICGTGSILLMTDGSGSQFVRGGWGWLLGDPGSGYALAVDGLRAAIRCWEGIGEETLLCEEALRFFALTDPRKLIDVIYAPEKTPSDIARFGKNVLSCCAAGDSAATRVVRGNMAALAENVAEMVRRVPEAFRVGVWGSVLTKNACARDIFAQELARLCPEAALVEMALPPELGAIVHAMRKRGAASDAALRRLRETYERYNRQEAP